MPIYNEETTIEKLQEQLENLQGKCEIILVDGGSTDATLSMIRPGFKVLHSEKGRANQMNLGAKEVPEIFFSFFIVTVNFRKDRWKKSKQ